MSWFELRLGELCVEGGIQTGPFGSQLHQSDYSAFGTPVVMPVDMVDGGVSTERIARVSDDHVSRLSRHVMREGDIVYARRGDVGRCSRVSKNEEGWLCGTGCLRLRPDETKVDSLFLYYALTNPKVVGWVRGHAIGATMPNLNTAILSEVPLRIPNSVDEQRRIASILMAYDNLIENNRKQIALLEEAAQRLYKEWFIDLRFPGHEDVEIVDGVPQGWQKQPLANCIDEEIGGGWGQECSSHEFSEIGYVVRATDMLDVESGSLASVPLRWHRASNMAPRALEAGDIIFEVSGGSREHGVGRSMLMTQEVLDAFGKPVMCASFCKRIKPKQGMSLFLAECISYEYRAEGLRRFEKRSAGNIINYHWKSFLSEYSVLIPDGETLDTFRRRIRLIRDMRSLAARDVRLAREARDRLLPKLMSGEIEV